MTFYDYTFGLCIPPLERGGRGEHPSPANILNSVPTYSNLHFKHIPEYILQCSNHCTLYSTCVLKEQQQKNGSQVKSVYFYERKNFSKRVLFLLVGMLKMFISKVRINVHLERPEKDNYCIIHQSVSANLCNSLLQGEIAVVSVRH